LKNRNRKQEVAFLFNSFLFISFGTVTSDVTRSAALVALLFVGAVLGGVTSFAASVASLNEAIFVALSFVRVVGAVRSLVARAATAVALDGLLVTAVTGEVTGLAAVVASGEVTAIRTGTGTAATTGVGSSGDALGGTVVGEVTDTTTVVALAIVDEVFSTTTTTTTVATAAATGSVVGGAGRSLPSTLVASGFLLLLTLLFGAVKLGVTLFATEVATHVSGHVVDWLVFCFK